MQSPNDEGSSPYSPGVCSSGLSRDHLNQLTKKWKEMYEEIERKREFKRHPAPIARIRKIMKMDEEVRMVEAGAPVVLAKACEMFILELSMRSWAAMKERGRKTLKRRDIAAAIQKNDLFDFLLDIVPREETTQAIDPSVLMAWRTQMAIMQFVQVQQQKERRREPPGPSNTTRRMDDE